MGDKNLSECLKSEAVRLGLCDQWKAEWEDNSEPQQLIDKFIKGIDFCLRRKWPTPEFIRQNFDAKLLRENGIIANDKHSVRNKNHIVILGESECTIRLDWGHPSIIYANGSSNVTIVVNTREKVSVEIRDSARVSILPNKDYPCDIHVFDFSDDSTIIAPKSVGYSKKKDYIKE